MQLLPGIVHTQEGSLLNLCFLDSKSAQIDCTCAYVAINLRYSLLCILPLGVLYTHVSCSNEVQHLDYNLAGPFLLFLASYDSCMADNLVFLISLPLSNISLFLLCTSTPPPLANQPLLSLPGGLKHWEYIVMLDNRKTVHRLYELADQHNLHYLIMQDKTFNRTISTFYAFTNVLLP